MTDNETKRVYKIKRNQERSKHSIRFDKLLAKRNAGEPLNPEEEAELDSVIKELTPQIIKLAEAMTSIAINGPMETARAALREVVKEALVLSEPIQQAFKRHPELNKMTDPSELGEIADLLGITLEELDDLHFMEVVELLDQKKGLSRARPEYFTKTPGDILLLTPKLSEALFTGKITPDNKPTLLKGMKTLVKLNYDDLSGEINFDLKLEPFDRVVHDAVCTLIAAGNRAITAAMIYRVMQGKPGSNICPSPNTQEDIEKSLMRGLRNTVLVDPRNENYKDPDGNRFEKILGTIYQYVAGQSIVNGMPTWTFFFNQAPLILRYAEQRNQITRIPPLLLDSGVSKDKRTQVLHDYLIRQIEYMKRNPKTRSNKMLLDTIFEQSRYFEGVEEISRRDKSRAVDKIRRILNHWIDEKYIKGFEFEKQQRANHAIIIKL